MGAKEAKLHKFGFNSTPKRRENAPSPTINSENNRTHQGGQYWKEDGGSCGVRGDFSERGDHNTDDDHDRITWYGTEMS